MTRNILIVLLMGSAVFSAGRADAAAVLQESFFDGTGGYAGNSLLAPQGPAVTGASGTWTSSSSLNHVAALDLGYSTGSQVLLSQSGSVQQLMVGTAFDRNAQRPMSYDVPGTGNSVLYFSGLVQPPAGTGFAMLQFLDNTTDVTPGDFGLQLGVNGGQVRLRARTAAGAANTDIMVLPNYTANKPLFFVAKAEIDAANGVDDRISVWVNPGNLSSEAAAGSPQLQVMTGSLDQLTGNRALDTYALRSHNFDSNKTVVFDEYRMGKTWADVTPHADVIRLGLLADAHVASASPSTNYGTSQTLEDKNGGTTGYHRKTYLRFDLSNAHQNAINEARLVLNILQPGGVIDTTQTRQWTFNVYGLNDGDAGEAWGESTITWNNAPQNNTTSGSALLAGTTLLGSFTILGDPTRQIMLDVTDLPGLPAFLRASQDELATLIITRETPATAWGGDVTTVHGFRSREYDNASFAATLLVNAEVPEPASLVLLGLAATSWAGYVRRRRTGR